jgi:predicted ArsR family transcriptional regulator
MTEASTGRALASASRLAILQLLRERAEPVDVQEVADATGLHPNTAREHLDRLVAARFVERTPERLGTPGRPRWRYALVRRPAAAAADERFRAAYLAEGPTWETDDPDARRQVAALELHLDDLGFDPEPDPPASTVHLRRCPYAALARERTELMCAVHLELIRDVLEVEGGPVTAERLDPFVGPQHCLLHLRGV